MVRLEAFLFDFLVHFIFTTFKKPASLALSCASNYDVFVHRGLQIETFRGRVAPTRSNGTC